MNGSGKHGIPRTATRALTREMDSTSVIIFRTHLNWFLFFAVVWWCCDLEMWSKSAKVSKARNAARSEPTIVHRLTFFRIDGDSENVNIIKFLSCPDGGRRGGLPSTHRYIYQTICFSHTNQKHQTGNCSRRGNFLSNRSLVQSK